MFSLFFKFRCDVEILRGRRDKRAGKKKVKTRKKDKIIKKS